MKTIDGSEPARDALRHDLREGGILTVILTDNAIAFDPTASEEVDTTAGLDDRGIGGLGIHIVTSLVDELAYKRVGDINQLTLIKNI